MALFFCASVVVALKSTTKVASVPSVLTRLMRVEALPLAAVTLAAPVAVDATSAPSDVTVVEALKLPIRALAVLVAALVWKAAPEEVNCKRCAPLESVTTEALILAVRNALAAALPALEAVAIASFRFATRLFVSEEADRVTDTETPEKPAPRKL